MKRKILAYVFLALFAVGMLLSIIWVGLPHESIKENSNEFLYMFLPFLLSIAMMSIAVCIAVTIPNENISQ